MSRPTLRRTIAATGRPAGPAGAALSQNQERYASLKTRVHQKLLSTLNMDAVKAESRHELRREVQSVLEKILREDHLPISMTERNRLAEEILDEVFGLGPLEPLLKDPTISDILVNTHKHVYKIGRASCRERV